MYNNARTIEERVALIEADLMRQPVSVGIVDRVSRYEFNKLKSAVQTHALILIAILTVLLWKLLKSGPIEVPVT